MINQIVYGESSHGFINIEVLDEALGEDRFVRSSLPREAAFLAARAYQAYRARGGTRTPTQPDFAIGAHAAVASTSPAHPGRGTLPPYFPTAQLTCP